MRPFIQIDKDTIIRVENIKRFNYDGGFKRWKITLINEIWTPYISNEDMERVKKELGIKWLQTHNNNGKTK